jgi:hypothetical protein
MARSSWDFRRVYKRGGEAGQEPVEGKALRSPADLKPEAKKTIIPEWKTGFRLPSFVYLVKEIRIDSDRLVRVFFTVNVTANGFITIAFTSVDQRGCRRSRRSPFLRLHSLAERSLLSLIAAILKCINLNWQVPFRIEYAALRTCFQQGFKRHSSMSHAMGREST